MSCPAVLWGMDPLVHVPMQLMIFQVKSLSRVPDQDGIFCHHSHPVRMVEVMGVVSIVQRATKYISYTLDDGTGAIQCIMWIPDHYQSVQHTSAAPWLQPHDLGQLVRIVGQPTEYKGLMQITFQPGQASLCHDPNDETVFRLRVLNQESLVYSKNIILPENVYLQAANNMANARAGNITHEDPRTRQEKVTRDILLDRIRVWVAGRQEFSLLDLQGDEQIEHMASEVVLGTCSNIHPNQVTAHVDKLLTECVLQLLSEKMVEYKDEVTMEFRVLKARCAVRNPMVTNGSAQEIIIVLDDSDEDTTMLST
ncbi:CST complex subunit STN1 [Haplosporangium sp. Z 767]|nr:CST complex subunit STN1 [Haplosporangium sp. Z 767]